MSANPAQDTSAGARAAGSDPLELRKPHEMVVMVPRSSRVTLTARRN
jgi:hypothetical protein